MIESVLAGSAVAPLALLVMADVALLASTTHLRSRLPAGVTPAAVPGSVPARRRPTRR